MASSPLREVSQGKVLLFVHVTASAQSDKIAGTIVDANSVNRIKVFTVQPAHSGKANSGVLFTLAKYIGIPKSLLAIKSGAASRLKTVLIEVRTDEQMCKIKVFCDSLGS